MRFPFSRLIDSPLSQRSQSSPDGAKPQPRPLPSTIATGTNPSSVDPEEPMQTEWQHQMMDAFDHDGYYGLAFKMYSFASTQPDRQKPTSSWATILEDRDSKRLYLLLLLTTLPEFIIRSLIRNTLPYDYYHDKELRSYVDKYMTPGEFPGIYANIPTIGADTSSYAIARQYENQGRWMTKNQVESMVARIESYLDFVPHFNQDVQDIDAYFPTSDPSTLNRAQSHSKRRYAPTLASRTKIKQWIRAIKRHFCTGLDASHADVPFKRCPMEIGWSYNVDQRLGQYKNNANTTYIYGVVNVLTRQPRPVGLGFPVPAQWSIFRIWEKDVTLVKVAEITASLLCSSYWTQGGLNCIEAGGMSLEGVPDDLPSWTTAMLFTLDQQSRLNILLSESLEWKRRSERTKAALSLPVMKKKYEDLRPKEVEAKDKFLESKARMGQVETELKAVRKEVEARRMDSIPEKSQNFQDIMIKLNEIKEKTRIREEVDRLFKATIFRLDDEPIEKSSDPQIQRLVDEKVERNDAESLLIGYEEPLTSPLASPDPSLNL